MSRENREMQMLQKWEAMNRKGKEKYVLQNGVLKFGLSMGLLMPVIQQIVDSIYRSNSYNSNNFLLRFVIYFIVFSIGGCSMHARFWNQLEKRYKS